MSDYQKEQAKILKNANEIQAKLADVIKKHNKMTSIHNLLMVLLTIIIIILTIFTLRTNSNEIGRYAITGGRGGVYLLDTKTSQLWIRTTKASLYLGTNENAMYESISRPVETSEEIGIKSETTKNNN